MDVDLVVVEGSGADHGLGPQIAALRRDHAPRLVLMLAECSGPARTRAQALGADDILQRDAPADLLAARIIALLRLCSGVFRENYRIGDLVIDLRSRHVRRGQANITLSQREYQLVVLLAQHGGGALARSAIIEKLWPGDLAVGDNAVDALASRLRRKIDGTATDRLVHTVRGVGYRLGEDAADAAPFCPRAA
jgi:two-component system copper resistance phosphate regulon response regulator CusR